MEQDFYNTETDEVISEWKNAHTMYTLYKHVADEFDTDLDYYIHEQEYTVDIVDNYPELIIKSEKIVSYSTEDLIKYLSIPNILDISGFEGTIVKPLNIKYSGRVELSIHHMIIDSSNSETGYGINVERV